MTLMALPFGVGPVGARASVCPSLAMQVLTSLKFIMILTMQDCRRLLVSVHSLYICMQFPLYTSPRARHLQ